MSSPKQDQTPYLLVASDMDGTLLSAEHVITPFTKNVLFRVESERRVPLIFATGRHHLSVRAVRDDLVQYFVDKRKEQRERQLTLEAHGAQDGIAPGFYLISSNGARIHDGKGRLIVQHNIEPEIVKELYEEFGLPYTKKKYAGPPGTVTPSLPTSPVVLKRPGIDPYAAASESLTCPVKGTPERDGGKGEAHVQRSDEDVIETNDEQPEEVVSTSAYTTDDWFMTSSFFSDAEMLRKFGVLPACVPFDIHNAANEGKTVFDAFPVKGVGKVCFRSSSTHILTHLENAIKERYGDRVSVAMSSRFCLDVMASGVSKAAALEALVTTLSSCAAPGNEVALSRVIAFGDSMNDADMLKAVGKGCLMANAQPRLKRCLPQCEVIGHHEENGVAQKLIEVFQLQ